MGRWVIMIRPDYYVSLYLHSLAFRSVCGSSTRFKFERSRPRRDMRDREIDSHVKNLNLKEYLCALLNSDCVQIKPGCSADAVVQKNCTEGTGRDVG